MADQPPRFHEGQHVIACDENGHSYWHGIIVEVAVNHVYGVRNDLGNIKYFHAYSLSLEDFTS